MIRVLVVDDDPTFRRGLSASLKTRGFAVDGAKNAEDALAYILQRPVDIVLLDINMPGTSGVAACQRVRTVAPKSGIIMLTVRDSEDDKVHALEMGADDYVTKPFRFRELLARIQALLRRTGVEDGPPAPVIKVGDLELELEHRILRKGGLPLHLSPKEFDLLAFLMQHKDIPVTHAKLLRAVWGPEYGSEPDYLRSYVKMIRKKIEADPAQPAYILTEPRVGYRLQDPYDPDAIRPSTDDDEDF